VPRYSYRITSLLLIGKSFLLKFSNKYLLGIIVYKVYYYLGEPMKMQEPSVPLSLRIPPESLKNLEALSDVTGRTKSFLASEAIELYLSTQAWQIKAIKEAVKKANNKKAKFISHQKVSDWLNSWGNKKEKRKPKGKASDHSMAR
jgi:RHH-type rel operon transcriptional repressor/antitoxin RelB